MENNGYTALHVAAMEVKDAVATQRVNANVNVNAVTNDGFTQLYDAAYNGHAIVADLLLGAGANPKAADKYGKTPAQRAEQYGHRELAERLRQAESRVASTEVPGVVRLPSRSSAAAAAAQRGVCSLLFFVATFILLSLWCIFVLFNGFGVRQR